MPTKADYENLVRKSQNQERAMDLSMLRAAAVQAEQLTGLPEWDQYLTKLQPLLEEARAAASDWLVKLGSALKDSDMRVAQWNYQACESRVQTLEEVMSLPKIIIEAHREHRA